MIPTYSGIRISTLAVLVLILAAGVVRRRPVLGLCAAMAWLFGFEIAWQWTNNLLGRAGPGGSINWVNIMVTTTEAAGWVIAAHALGLRPQRWLVVAMITGWIVWLGLGFPVNAKMPHTGFSVEAELLNEGLKTLWGLAYLFPLLREVTAPRASAEPAEVKVDVGVL